MPTPNDNVITGLDFRFHPLCQWEREGEGRCVKNAAGLVVCKLCGESSYRCDPHWEVMSTRRPMLQCDGCDRVRLVNEIVKFVRLDGRS